MKTKVQDNQVRTDSNEKDLDERKQPPEEWIWHKKGKQNGSDWKWWTWKMSKGCPIFVYLESLTKQIKTMEQN